MADRVKLLFLVIAGFIAGQRDRGKFDRFLAAVDDVRCEGSGFDIVHQQCEHVVQMGQFCRSQLVSRAVAVHRSHVADFRADDRADAGELLVQGFLHRSRGRTDHTDKAFLRDGKRVFFICSVRDEIHPARQYLAHRADLRRNVFDAV